MVRRRRGTSILGNSITGNVGLGIDLLSLPLPVPVITELEFDGVDLTVSGTLTSSADDYRIELFANDVCDASGFGEGQSYLGSIDVTAGDFVAGTATFSTVIAAPAERSNVTATATNSAGSTSTFSACVDATTTVATFTNAAGGNSWTEPGNWSTGVVPGLADVAVIPVGPGVVIGAADDVEVGELTAEGEVRVEGQFTINDDSTASGLLDVIGGARLVLDAVLTVNGPTGQLFVDEGPGVPGLIEVRDGGGFAGNGLIANSGIVAFSGSGVTTIGAGLTWNSGVNSLIDITSGIVDVQTNDFDARGIISVAPGAVLRAQSGFTMTDTSSLEFFVDGPVSDEANYGRFELGDGVFTANGTVVTTPLNGYAPTGDTYPLIACPSGSCLDGTFDEVFGGRIESRTANEIGFVLVNTYVGPTAALVPGNWANTLGWSFGLVPDATDAAAIPGGQFVRVTSGQFSVGSLTVAGDLRVVDTASGAGDRQLTINEDSVIEEAGRLFVGGSFDCTVGDGRVTPVPPFPDDECVPSVTTLQLSADLRVDGDLQVVPRVFDYGTYQLVSDPVLELDSGASLSGGFGAFGGTVLLSGQVVKSDPGTVTFGPDLDVQLFYGAGNDTRGVLAVTAGTLDIQSAPPTGSFTANGTIEVGPGATVSVAGDLTLRDSSVIEIGIDGPSSSTTNSGRIALPTGSLSTAGTLRTVLDSYTPGFDDIYSVITCSTGSCAGGSFDSLDVEPLTPTSTTSALRLRGPELPVELALDLERTSSATVMVGSSAIAVESFNRTAVTAAGGTTTDVAASSLTSISADDNSLASIPLRDTLIAEIILQSETLRSIPLVSIDIEGGWTRIIAGDQALEREPTTSLTLGQVLDSGTISNETTPAGRVGAIPLGAINVDGTPLGAIPLGAIALGTTPLGAIPLGAIASDPSPWCEVLEGFLQANETCESALLDLTVTEVALRGAPLGAIPLGAIPLGAIDLSASPLGAIPLGAIDLSASPLGAIPLGAIPLGAIGVAGSPLGAIPLGAIPLGAIPLGAIDLVDSPLGAIPLGAIELDADVVADLPTSLVLEESASGRVVGAPLGAIPLGAILLADVPLGAIPLEENGVSLDWCAVLAEIAPAFACTPQTLGATTIAELAVQGVPLGAIPLGAIPLGAIPLGAIDIGSTPLGAIPLGAIPLGAIPLGAIPLGAIPLGAIPLGAIDIADAPLGAIPLGAIPLGAIDIAGSPLGAIPLGAIPLGAIPLGAIPLGAIPLGAIPLGAIPLGAIDIANSPLGAITVSTPLGAIPLGAIPLGAIDIAGSPLGAIPLGAIPLGAISFDCSLVDCANGVLRDAVRANAVQGAPTLADLSGALDGIRVGDLVGYIDGVSEAELRRGHRHCQRHDGESVDSRRSHAG